MDELYRYIGDRIRKLRDHHGGPGISQEALASEMKTTANTVSRWETAAYKPSIRDLTKLAHFFGVSVSVFFPNTENSRLNALLSATGDLPDEDIKELTEYARFRKARRMLERTGRRRKRSP